MKEMVGGCCVCSDDRGWPENPLVYCDGQACTVAVHQACYGIVTVPTGPWYCRKCESQERAVKVKCELCPSKYGALKRTDNGGWAHVVCALYIPEVRFGNVTTMEPIQLQLIPQERFNKVCYICEEGGKASNAGVGACMQCNKSGCKQQFHVTCAQGLGLLCEEAGNYLDNVKYCGYCQHHYSKLKKGINIKTIPPYKPLPSETHQSDSSSEKETDNSAGALSGASANTATVSSSGSNAANSSLSGANASVAITSASAGGCSTAPGVASTATTGKRKYYSNSKAKIEKSTANNNQQSIASSTNTATSKTHQKKSNTNSSISSSSSATTDAKSSSSSSSSTIAASSASSFSTKNNNHTNNTQKASSTNSSVSVSASLVSGIKEDQFKVEVKVEVKKEVEDAVAAASAAASAIAAPGKGKKRKANSRTPTPNIVSECGSAGGTDSVAEVKKETSAVEAKKIKPIDLPTPPNSTPTTTPAQSAPTTTTTPPINHTPQTTPTVPTPSTTIAHTPTTTTTASSLSAPSAIVPHTTVAPSTVNSLVVSVPLLPLVPSTVVASQTASPRPIVTAVAVNSQLEHRLTPTTTQVVAGLVGESRQQQQVLSGSLDINGIPVSQNSLLLEQDAMLTSELTGSGGLKIMFEKQPPPSSAVQAEIDRITPTNDAPMKRSRSQSMEKNDKIMRSSKKRGSNGLANVQNVNSMPPSSSSASPVAGCSGATPPPSVVSTITKRASRSQHPTPPPTISSQFGQMQSGMLGMSISTSNQIKDSPPSSPSSESLGGPPVGRKKGRKSAPASVSSSSSSNAAKDIKDSKDTKENIKLFQNGVHAPHMLGNQLNPNSNMAQKMSDHLSSELEAHSIFNSTESSATLVGPQLHNRVLASARSSSTGGSSTASAGSGLSSMLGGGSGAIPQTLDQLLERQWEQGSQFLMEQAQHFDIASLLSCLHQLRAENTRLEEHVSSLLQRRDHLLAVNARLAIPLTGAPATSQSSHPHTVNNIHPNLAGNHADMTSRSSRHGSSASYSHMVPLENGLPSEAAAYVQQQHGHRSATSHSGQTQPSPTIRHSSSGYVSGSSGVGVSGLLRTSESSSGGGSGSRSSSSRSHHHHHQQQQQQQQQQQHYMYQPTQQQQQMQMRRDSDIHHHPSSKPS